MGKRPAAWTWKAVKEATGIEKGAGPNGQTAYRVRWRVGGKRGAPERTRTKEHLFEARAFRGRLVANGYHDPDETTMVLIPAPRLDGESTEAQDDAEAIEAGIPTLREAIEQDITQRDKAGGRTKREYRSKARHHVYPVVLQIGRKLVGPLGDMPINEVATPEIMVAWLAYMKNKKWTSGRGKDKIPKLYSPKQITEIACSILSPTFTYAMNDKRKWITAHPIRGNEDFKLPERKGRTVRIEHILTKTEFQLWIDCCYDVDHQLVRWDRAGTKCTPDRSCDIDHHTGDVVTFILGTGMRWGETTGLRWCDVDLGTGMARINQVITEDEVGKLYADTDEGKTPNAFRTIRLPTSVVTMLKRRKTRRKRGDLSLIFGAPGGLERAPYWRRSNFHTARWPKVEALALGKGSEKNPSPHRLRHSNAVATIIAVGLETASKRLGHADASITSGLYGHLTPEADQAAADAIEREIFEPPKQSTSE